MNASETKTRFDMQIRHWAVGWTTALLLIASLPATARADAATEREYQLKAAFLYNFIMFIDSPRLTPPEEKARKEEAEKPILIGIIGKDPFGEAFEPLKSKEVRDRPVMVKRFKGLKLPVDTEELDEDEFEDLEAIKECHILFVCASERPHLAAILAPVRRYSLLTVSDMPGFLDAGGIVNFVIEEKKVRFEINVAAAARANLEIRSKLLRLAKRIVKTDLVEGQSNGGNEPPTRD